MCGLLASPTLNNIGKLQDNPSLERTGDAALKVRDGRHLRSRMSQRLSLGRSATSASNRADAQSWIRI